MNTREPLNQTITCRGAGAALLMVLLLILAGCASAPLEDSDTRRAERNEASDRTVSALLTRAETQPSPHAERTYLEAARMLFRMNRDRDAARVLEQVDPEPLADEEPELAAEVMILQARLALEANRPEVVIGQLDENLPLSLQRLSPGLRQDIHLLRAEAYRADNRPLDSAHQRIAANALLSGDARRRNHEQIWHDLTALTVEQLGDLVDTGPGFERRGWYELAVIGKAHQNDLDRQLLELERWQQDWARHPAARQMPRALQMLETLARERPRNLALLLPLQTQAGKVVRDGFMAAYFNVQSIGGQVPAIRFYDTSETDDILALHRQASEDGADMIIGPLQKHHVARLQEVRDLQVPTLALNMVEGDNSRSDLLFQFSLSPENEARQVAERAWEDGHRFAAVLSPLENGDSDYYARKRQSFVEHWQELGGTIVEQEAFQENYTQVIENLLDLSDSEARHEELESLLGQSLEFTPRRRQDVDFIFLIAEPGPARQIKPSLAYLYAGNLPVYATQDVFSGQQRPLVDNDLNGIRFGDSPWLLADQDPLRSQVQSLFPQNRALYMRLQAFGVDAFRLYPRLRQLQALDGGQVHGATGLLRMDDQGRIHQQLNWAAFHEGLALPMDG